MNQQPELPEYYRDLEIAQALNKKREENRPKVEVLETQDDAEPP